MNNDRFCPNLELKAANLAELLVKTPKKTSRLIFTNLIKDMLIYATRLNSSNFDPLSRLYNANVNKEVVFHTEKCSVVIENRSQIKTFNVTETFFNEIERKHRKCKLCELMQSETERQNYENEEQERQRKLREEFGSL